MKKTLFMVLLLVGAFFLLTPEVLAVEAFAPCQEESVLKVLRVVGYVIYVAKIVIPLLLIIMGSIDFAKAVISSDDKAMKDAGSTLLRRFIAAVIIFLLPTILNLLLGLVDNIESFDPKGNFNNCTECIFNPTNDASCRPNSGSGRN